MNESVEAMALGVFLPFFFLLVRGHLGLGMGIKGCFDFGFEIVCWVCWVC